MRRAAGFTIGELLLAVALLTVIITTLVGLTMTAIRANQKAVLLGTATTVADSLLNQTLYEVDDSPATHASFWGHSGTAPWRTGNIVQGGVDYQFAIYVQNVGAYAPGNRLKKTDLILRWWNSEAAGGVRQGYGRLELEATRLVNEVAP